MAPIAAPVVQSSLISALSSAFFRRISILLNHPSLVLDVSSAHCGRVAEAVRPRQVNVLCELSQKELFLGWRHTVVCVWGSHGRLVAPLVVLQVPKHFCRLLLAHGAVLHERRRPVHWHALQDNVVKKELPFQKKEADVICDSVNVRDDVDHGCNGQLL